MGDAGTASPNTCRRRSDDLPRRVLGGFGPKWVVLTGSPVVLAPDPGARICDTSEVHHHAYDDEGLDPRRGRQQGVR